MKKFIIILLSVITLSSCGSLLHYDDGFIRTTVDTRDFRYRAGMRNYNRDIYYERGETFQENYYRNHGYLPPRVVEVRHRCNSYCRH